MVTSSLRPGSTSLAPLRAVDGANTPPTLSVVLVAAPGRGDLTEALDSIVPPPGATPYGEVEIIVVEASHGAWEQAALPQRWSARDPLIRVLRAAGTPVSSAAPSQTTSPHAACTPPADEAAIAAAWNRGIAASSAGLVAFLDPQDRCRPTRLSVQLAFHRENPAIGFSFCDRATSRGIGASFAHAPRFARRHAGRATPFILPGDAVAQLFAEKTVAISTVMARADVIRRAGGLDADLPIAAAWDLWLRMAADAPVGCIPAQLVHSAPSPRPARHDQPAARLVEMLLIAARHADAARRIDRVATRVFHAELLRIRAAIAESGASARSWPRLRARSLRVWAWICQPRDRTGAARRGAQRGTSGTALALLLAGLPIFRVLYAA